MNTSEQVWIDGRVTELRVFVKKVADLDGAMIGYQPDCIPPTAIERGEVGIIDFYADSGWTGRWTGMAYISPSVASSIAAQLNAQQDAACEDEDDDYEDEQDERPSSAVESR